MSNHYTNPQPLLSVQYWRKLGYDALRHTKSGVVIVFRGTNPTAARNRCLKALNRMKPQKPIRIPAGIDNL